MIYNGKSFQEEIDKETDPKNQRYSIEQHGDGYALYWGRNKFHHGFNLGHITEMSPETRQLIEKALNNYHR